MPTRKEITDRGATSVEYAGMITLVAVLVTAILLAIGAVRLPGRVGAAVCTILSLGLGDCAAPEVTADPHLPDEPCVVSALSRRQAVEATIISGHGAAGQDFELAQLSDGSYRITRLDEAALGVEFGVGVGGSATGWDHSIGAGATAEAGIDGQLSRSDVWYTDADGAQRFFDEVYADGLKDATIGDSTLSRGLWEWGESRIDDLTGHQPVVIDEPDETVVQGGVMLNAGAEAAAGFTAGVSGGETQALGYRQNRDGTTTVYLRSTVSAEAAVQFIDDAPSEGPDGGEGIVVPPRFERGQSVDLVTAVTVDGSNQLSSVSTTLDLDGEASPTLARIAEWAGSTKGAPTGDRIVYTSTLPIRSEADRRIALEYLASSGVAQLGLSNGAAPILTVAAAPAVVTATDRYRDAVLERGQLTRQSYVDRPKNGKEFGAGVDLELGIAFGIGGEYNQRDQRTSAAAYWDGVGWTTWEACR